MIKKKKIQAGPENILWQGAPFPQAPTCLPLGATAVPFPRGSTWKSALSMQMHVESPLPYFLMANWSYIFVAHLAVFIQKYVSWRLLHISIWVFNTSLFSWLFMTSTLWLFHNSFNCLDFFPIYCWKNQCCSTLPHIYFVCTWKDTWRIDGENFWVNGYVCCVDSVVRIVMFSPPWRVFSGQPVGQEPAKKSLSLEESYLMGCCLLEFRFLGLAEWALGRKPSESWSLGWVTLVGGRHWVKRPPGAIRQGLLQPPPQPQPQPQPQQFNHRNEHPVFA